MNDLAKAHSIAKTLVDAPVVRSKRLYLPGRYPTLNEYTKASRANKFASAQLKKNTENMIGWAAKSQLRGWKAKGPVIMVYCWVVRDRRTDRDNIVFARKFVQDALVRIGALHDDGWRYVVGFADTFAVDKAKEGVEVWILEVGAGGVDGEGAQIT